MRRTLRKRDACASIRHCRLLNFFSRASSWPSSDAASSADSKRFTIPARPENNSLPSPGSQWPVRPKRFHQDFDQDFFGVTAQTYGETTFTTLTASIGIISASLSQNWSGVQWRLRGVCIENGCEITHLSLNTRDPPGCTQRDRTGPGLAAESPGVALGRCRRRISAASAAVADSAARPALRPWLTWPSQKPHQISVN